MTIPDRRRRAKAVARGSAATAADEAPIDRRPAKAAGEAPGAPRAPKAIGKPATGRRRAKKAAQTAGEATAEPSGPSKAQRPPVRRLDQPREGFVAVGRVVTPWGVRGDLRVIPLTDFGRRFQKGSALFLAGQRRVVAASRRHSDTEILVRFEAIDTPEMASGFRDKLLEIPEDELTPLPPGSYYRWQLEGLAAVTAGGVALGSVSDVMETGANDVLVITGEHGVEHLVPFIEEFAVVDLEKKRVTITPIPGLLD